MITHHVLHITEAVATKWPPPNIHRFDLDYAATLDCPGPDYCHGWEECMECREVADFDDDDVWGDSSGEEQRVLHGVDHTWHDGWGWTIPFDGCVVRADPDQIGDSIHEIVADYGDGDYLVEDVWWDGTSVSLLMVGRVDGEPLPEAGAWRL